MRTACLSVSALSFVISTVAAASYTSSFYTTEKVPTADIIYHEEVSQSASENSCLVKCAKERCCRYRWNNTVCSLRNRNTSHFSGKHTLQYKKVSCAFDFSFAL